MKPNAFVIFLSVCAAVIFVREISQSQVQDLYHTVFCFVPSLDCQGDNT